MLSLAVATGAETLERMRDPLSERGIEARHVRSRGRTFDLASPDPAFDGYDVGYVYPPRLMEGDVVDALLEVPWVNGRAAVSTSRNKAGVLARLGGAGLPVPETVLVSNPVEEADLVEAFDRLGPPVVVKPNSATRGIGVAKVEDVDSLLGVVDYLEALHELPATGDKSYLLQSYVPDARDYRVMVVDGAYAGAVERRLPAPAREAGRWKHNVHRSAAATAVTPPTELRRLAERTAATLDIDLLGVDLLVGEDGPLVAETNARPTIDEETKYEPDFYDRLAGLIRDRATSCTT